MEHGGMRPERLLLDAARQYSDYTIGRREALLQQLQLHIRAFHKDAPSAEALAMSSSPVPPRSKRATLQDSYAPAGLSNDTIVNAVRQLAIQVRQETMHVVEAIMICKAAREAMIHVGSMPDGHLLELPISPDLSLITLANPSAAAATASNELADLDSYFRKMMHDTEGLSNAPALCIALSIPPEEASWNPMLLPRNLENSYLGLPSTLPPIIAYLLRKVFEYDLRDASATIDKEAGKAVKLGISVGAPAAAANGSAAAAAGGSGELNIAGSPSLRAVSPRSAANGIRPLEASVRDPMGGAATYGPAMSMVALSITSCLPAPDSKRVPRYLLGTVSADDATTATTLAIMFAESGVVLPAGKRPTKRGEIAAYDCEMLLRYRHVYSLIEYVRLVRAQQCALPVYKDLKARSEPVLGAGNATFLTSLGEEDGSAAATAARSVSPLQAMSRSLSPGPGQAASINPNGLGTTAYTGPIGPDGKPLRQSVTLGIPRRPPTWLELLPLARAMSKHLGISTVGSTSRPPIGAPKSALGSTAEGGSGAGSSSSSKGTPASAKGRLTGRAASTPARGGSSAAAVRSFSATPTTQRGTGGAAAGRGSASKAGGAGAGTTTVFNGPASRVPARRGNSLPPGAGISAATAAAASAALAAANSAIPTSRSVPASPSRPGMAGTLSGPAGSRSTSTGRGRLGGSAPNPAAVQRGKALIGGPSVAGKSVGSLGLHGSVSSGGNGSLMLKSAGAGNALSQGSISQQQASTISLSNANSSRQLSQQGSLAQQVLSQPPGAGAAGFLAQAGAINPVMERLATTYGTSLSRGSAGGSMGTAAARKAALGSAGKRGSGSQQRVAFANAAASAAAASANAALGMGRSGRGAAGGLGGVAAGDSIDHYGSQFGGDGSMMMGGFAPGEDGYGGGVTTMYGAAGPSRNPAAFAASVAGRSTALQAAGAALMNASLGPQDMAILQQQQQLQQQEMLLQQQIQQHQQGMPGPFGSGSYAASTVPPIAGGMTRPESRGFGVSGGMAGGAPAASAAAPASSRPPPVSSSVTDFMNRLESIKTNILNRMGLQHPMDAVGGTTNISNNNTGNGLSSADATSGAAAAAAMAAAAAAGNSYSSGGPSSSSSSASSTLDVSSIGIPKQGISGLMINGVDSRVALASPAAALAATTLFPASAILGMPQGLPPQQGTVGAGSVPASRIAVASLKPDPVMPRPPSPKGLQGGIVFSDSSNAPAAVYAASAEEAAAAAKNLQQAAEESHLAQLRQLRATTAEASRRGSGTLVPFDPTIAAATDGAVAEGGGGGGGGGGGRAGTAGKSGSRNGARLPMHQVAESGTETGEESGTGSGSWTNGGTASDTEGGSGSGTASATETATASEAESSRAGAAAAPPQEYVVTD